MSKLLAIKDSSNTTQKTTIATSAPRVKRVPKTPARKPAEYCTNFEIIDEIIEHEQYDMSTSIGGVTVSMSVSRTKTIKHKKTQECTVIKIGF